MLYTQQQLFKKIKELKPLLYEKFGISRIAIFGSYAINAQDEKSDVDLIVELTKPLGWAYFSLPAFFEQQLHTKVDITTKESLKPRIKEQVLKQVVYID